MQAALELINKNKSSLIFGVELLGLAGDLRPCGVTLWFDAVLKARVRARYSR